MRGIRYTEEFKQDAISQVVDRGYSVVEVSQRLGISSKSLYAWMRKPAKAARLSLMRMTNALRYGD